jgi:hypothetical protein
MCPFCHYVCRNGRTFTPGLRRARYRDDRAPARRAAWGAGGEDDVVVEWPPGFEPLRRGEHTKVLVDMA